MAVGSAGHLYVLKLVWCTLRDRNWLEFLAVLDATFADLDTEGSVTEAAKAACAERIAHAQELFGKVVEVDGVKERAGHLALLELEKRSQQHGLAAGQSLYGGNATVLTS